MPGRDLLKELQGTIGMKFDENLTYLNDPGTKKLGFCYLDKLTDGIFECIKETTTTVNDLSCFVNFSNKENSDRLSNLGKTKYINKNWNLTGVTAEQVIEFINKSLEDYDYIYIFMREHGNFELDFSLITKKDNAEVTFYHTNGGHTITFTNIHPNKIKFGNNWGDYATFRYNKSTNNWYLKADKGTIKLS